jgi:hypothetical protein
MRWKSPTVKTKHTYQNNVNDNEHVDWIKLTQGKFQRRIFANTTVNFKNSIKAGNVFSS